MNSKSDTSASMMKSSMQAPQETREQLPKLATGRAMESVFPESVPIKCLHASSFHTQANPVTFSFKC